MFETWLLESVQCIILIWAAIVLSCLVVGWLMR